MTKLWQRNGVTVLRGDHKRAKKKIRHIVKLYDEYESYSYKVAEKIYVATVDGHDGGVVIDASLHNNPTVGRIIFAAYGYNSRRKGCTKRILKVFPELTGISVDFVELNPFDSEEPWRRLGFHVEDMMNLTKVLAKDKLVNFVAGAKKQEGGMSMADIREALKASGMDFDEMMKED